MNTSEVKWEYEIRNINHGNSEMKAIREMVENGYRLVAAAPYWGGNSLYFEREKPTQQSEQ